MSLVRRVYTKDHGCYYVANRTIQEGEVVLRERSFAHSINTSFSRLACAVCLAYNTRGWRLQCPGCRSRYYCSEACLRYECPPPPPPPPVPIPQIAPYVSDPTQQQQPPTASVLATSLSIEQEAPAMATEASPVMSEMSTTASISDQRTLHTAYECALLKRIGRCSSQMTMSEYDETRLLVAVLARRAAVLDGYFTPSGSISNTTDASMGVAQHAEGANERDHEHRWIESRAAVEELHQLYSDASVLSLSDVKSYRRMGALVVKHAPERLFIEWPGDRHELCLQLYCAIRFNSFGLWFHRTTANDVVGVGSFVSLAASRFNHSCSPSAARVQAYSLENEIVALQEIAGGAVVDISYIALSQPGGDRRKYLKDNYAFMCECIRCRHAVRSSEHRVAADDHLLDEQLAAWECRHRTMVCSRKACNGIMVRSLPSTERHCNLCGTTAVAATSFASSQAPTAATAHRPSSKATKKSTTTTTRKHCKR